MKKIFFNELKPRGQAFHIARSELVKETSALSQHTHDFVEIFWVEKGEGLHRVNGKMFHVGPQDAWLILPRVRHNHQVIGERLVVTNVGFGLDRFKKVLARYGEPHESRYLSDLSAAYPIVLAPEMMERLRKMAITLSQGPRDLLALEWFLLVFLKEAASVSFASSRVLPFWLENALQQLRTAEHFSKDVKHFYRLCYRAPEHTARTCKKLLGKSPSALLNEARLRGAASKLSMTGDAVTEIALDCGFQSLSRFYALFKESYGVAPAAFRRNRAVG